MTRLRRNFLLLAASNLLTPLFSMVLVLALARLQGVEVLGKYSLMMTVFIVGQSCVGLGLPVIITREVARRHGEAGRYFLNACLVTGAVAVIALAGAWAWLAHSSDAELRIALPLVLAALLPTLLIVHGEAVLLAFERAGDLVAINFVETSVRALIGAGIVVAGGGLVALAGSLLVVRIGASLAYAAMLRRRHVALRGAADAGLCRELIRAIPVLGAIPVVNAIYGRADVLLLTWLGTWTELGLYSAALRIVDVARTVAPAYARALYPVLARLRSEPGGSFAAVVQRSTREITLLVLPVVIVLCAFAEPVVRTLFGAHVSDAGAALRILAWSMIPATLATTLAQILFAAGLQAIDLRINLVSTLFIGIAGGLAIPVWGASGAAVAVLLANSLYAALQYASVRQAVVDPALLPFLGRLALVALIGAGVIVSAHSVSTITAGTLAVCASALTIWATRMLSRDDVDRMHAFIRGRDLPDELQGV